MFSPKLIINEKLIGESLLFPDESATIIIDLGLIEAASII